MSSLDLDKLEKLRDLYASTDDCGDGNDDAWQVAILEAAPALIEAARERDRLREWLDVCRRRLSYWMAQYIDAEQRANNWRADVYASDVEGMRWRDRARAWKRLAKSWFQSKKPAGQASEEVPAYFDRWDVCAAYFWFAAHYHGGQGCKLYRVFGRLDKLKYRPPQWDDLSSNAQQIYADLVHKFEASPCP